MTVDGRVVGRVVALWRYPVKSMASESLDRADVSWFGLAGDRRWAFVRDGQERSNFPWLTIRQRADLLHHVPRFADPDRPESSTTLVTTPGGKEFDVADPALAAELGPGVRVIKQNRGSFDGFPLSLLSVQTVARLGDLAGAELDPRRFRPNLLIDVPGAEFPEDGWVGRTIRIGGLRMRIDDRDRRCVVVTIDPRTLERNKAVLAAAAQHRGNQVGVYGSVVEPGPVALGDAVEVTG